MIKLIICLIIIVLLYYSMVLTVNNKCIGENEVVIIPKISMSRISENQLSKTFGFNTINVQLDSYIPCGIYSGESFHGPVIVIVGKFASRSAFINFVNYKQDLDKIERFELQNLKRLISVDNDNDIVRTYNKGCCGT